jgi:hypothetical protein
MVAVIHFLLAREEADARWRWTGYVASVLIALFSTSRMALIALAIMIPITAFVGKLSRPVGWIAAGAAVAGRVVRAAIDGPSGHGGGPVQRGAGRFLAGAPLAGRNCPATLAA